MTYFKSHNIWGNDQYYGAKLKVVGLLKEPSDQVYFSKDMCRMLSMRIDSGIYRLRRITGRLQMQTGPDPGNCRRP